MLNRFYLLTLAACLFVLVSTMSATAQLAFNLDVHDSVITLYEGQLVEFKATLSNTGTEPVAVRASRYRNQLPGETWATAMCFGEQCFLPSMDVTPPEMIAPGATILFKLSVTTEDAKYGNTQVRTGIRFDTGDFTAGINQEFVVNVDGTSSVGDNPNSFSLTFPNPANRSLSIPLGAIFQGETELRLTVCDAVGRVVSVSQQKYNANEPLRVDVSALRPGFYLFQASSNLHHTRGVFTKVD
jgi:hypothetical protein